MERLEDKNPKKINISFIIYISIILFSLSTIYYLVNSYVNKEISYDEFLKLVNQNEISEVIVTSDNIEIEPKEGTEYYGRKLYTANMGDKDLVQKLTDAGVTFKAKNQKESIIMNFVLTWVLPLVLFYFLWKILFSKMAGKMGGGIGSIGKNNAKVYVENEIGITFKDVAGQEEAKESLEEVIDYLNRPKKYTEIGAKLPKGVLLVGPPGTGKTLLAKAVAGEAKVPFFSLSGSSFVEMFVGVGASRVRELFKEAESKAPCIIFIDEIDAIGKSRDNQYQSNDEREQTLNQLLSEMDGFDSTKGIVILAATNRPDVLDKALLRPGRFDRRVIVDKPDLKGREAILKVHSKDVCLDDKVDLNKIAKGTSGAVGADLANIVNEAALRAVRQNRKVVSQEDLQEAIDLVIAGKEKKDAILSKKEKEYVAYHEVGHALTAAILDGTDPVHKITIVPRTTGALGYTMQIEDEEKHLPSKESLLNMVIIRLAGRAAEEEAFGLVSAGASDDIQKATKIARAMVTVYGMSDKFDMVALESIQDRYLDGRAVRNCSEETSTMIDNEVLSIIKDSHNKARDILKTNRDLLDKIAKILIEKETIFGDEFMQIVREKYPDLKKKDEESTKEDEKQYSLDMNKDNELDTEKSIDVYINDESSNKNLEDKRN